MASEEQYLDDLLKSMMENEPKERTMDEAISSVQKDSPISSEALADMLDKLEAEAMNESFIPDADFANNEEQNTMSSTEMVLDPIVEELSVEDFILPENESVVELEGINPQVTENSDFNISIDGMTDIEIPSEITKLEETDIEMPSEIMEEAIDMEMPSEIMEEAIDMEEPSEIMEETFDTEVSSEMPEEEELDIDVPLDIMEEGKNDIDVTSNTSETAGLDIAEIDANMDSVEENINELPADENLLNVDIEENTVVETDENNANDADAIDLEALMAEMEALSANEESDAEADEAEKSNQDISIDTGNDASFDPETDVVENSENETVDDVSDDMTLADNLESGNNSNQESSEDLTDILDLLNAPDADISAIDEMLQKVANNETIETDEDEMLALLNGIQEAEAQDVNIGDEPVIAMDSEDSESAEEETGKKKKKKREKKNKKKKDGETSGDLEALLAENGEHDLSSEIPNIKEKKPGFFARLIAMLTEEEEEETPENAEGVELEIDVSDENAAILAELSEEDRKKNVKDKKKKKKKGKDKKAEGESEEGEGEASDTKKKKKPKKEKKVKEPKEKVKSKKVLSKKAFFALIGLCATLIAAVVCLSAFLPDYSEKKLARKAYYSGDYETAYLNLLNKNLNSSDQIIFERSQAVMQLRRKLASYKNRSNLGMKQEALDALLQGIKKYDEIAAKDYYGAEDLINLTYSEICDYLTIEYGISAEEAREINTYDKEQYVQKVYSVIYGTDFYLPGEEPITEESIQPEDVLEAEEDIISD